MDKDFIDSGDPNKAMVLPDRLMINQCFYHFKTLFKQLEKRKGGPGVAGIPAAIKSADDEASTTGASEKADPAKEAEI